MGQQTMLMTDKPKPCPRCKRAGERNATEILPDGGVLFMVVHDDGMVCRWSEYKNMDALWQYKRTKNPTTIKCPRCGEDGRVNWYRPDTKLGRQRMEVRYYIEHKKIDPTEKLPPRCQSFTQVEKDEILKQLGRYISTPKIVEKIRTKRRGGSKGTRKLEIKSKQEKYDIETVLIEAEKILKENPITISPPEKSFLGTVIICPDPKCRRKGREGTLHPYFDKAKGIQRYRVMHLDGTPRHYVPIKKAPKIIAEISRREKLAGGILTA